MPSRVHVLLQFVELAQVVAELRDDVLRPGGHFQLQLVKLHHQVRLADFEGIHHRAGKEIERCGVDGSWPLFVFEPAAQGMNQPENQHGVQVIHRLGLAAESVFLGIAGQGQNIFDSQARQRMQARFEKRAVAVFAGEMGDRGQPMFEDVGNKSFRRQRRIASREGRSG